MVHKTVAPKFLKPLTHGCFLVVDITACVKHTHFSRGAPATGKCALPRDSAMVKPFGSNKQGFSVFFFHGSKEYIELKMLSTSFFLLCRS